jgi:hypothetical protein
MYAEQLQQNSDMMSLNIHMRVNLNQTYSANFPSDVTYPPSGGQSERFFRAFPFTEPKWRTRIINQRFILVGKSAVPSRMYA